MTYIKFGQYYHSFSAFWVWKQQYIGFTDAEENYGLKLEEELTYFECRNINKIFFHI